MIFALLPVKAPQNAKQRLSGLLTPQQREALAQAMYQEMMEKLRAVRGLDRIVVVTSDEWTARQARTAGALVFQEEDQAGHSHSADAAAQRAIRMGARTVLMLPIDVPLAAPGEIEELTAAAHLHQVVVVPSADGTGTNALARTPPDIIQSRFGPGSLQAHLEQARARGVTAEVLRLPGLMLDIDTPEDVAELFRRAPECRIARMLRETCALTL